MTVTRILVIEDSPTQAAEVAFILEDAGFEVEVAEDGIKGLECARASRFDLVLSDVLMPRMAGYELCRRVKDQTANLPVILVTTLNGAADMLRGLECGADGYLNKPYDPEVLVATITNLLAVRAERAAAGTRSARGTSLTGQPFVLPSNADQVLDYLQSVIAHFSRREDHADQGATQTAEALRRSEERFALAVSGANDGLWDWDLSSNQMYFSPRFMAILGCDGELPPHPEEWLKRIQPDDRRRFDADLRVHLDGESSHFVNEHRLQRQNGTYIWVLARGASVRNATGKAYRIAGSLTDISQRKKIEETLLTIGAELNAVLKAFPDLCIRLDADGVVLGYHAGRAEEWPIDDAAFVGKRLSDFLPDEVGRRVAEAAARARQTSSLVSIEYALPVAGRDRVWEARFSPLANGQVLAIVREITEHKREEATLRFTQLAVNRAPDPVFLMGSDGRFLYVNDAACRALGFSREELLSMSASDIDDDGDPATWSAFWERVKQRGSAFAPARYRTRQGHRLSVGVHASYLTFAGQEYLCASARPAGSRHRGEDGRMEPDRAGSAAGGLSSRRN